MEVAWFIMTKQTIMRKSFLEIPTRLMQEEDSLPPIVPELTPRAYKIYPYAIQELFDNQYIKKIYETLEMENEFLRVTVIPELGGRLLVFDKKANRELFFRNTQLTPVMAGLTGAWMRMGCEFNFPGSHSVTSNRPVSCHFQKNSDNSATIVISDIEWCSGMEWRIQLTLYADSCALMQTSGFFNRTAYHNRGYFWTNAKCEASEHSEFLFPKFCSKGAVHPPMDVTRIRVFNLPSDNTVDLRKNKNIVFPLPLFFNDLRTSFFGCYETDKDAGLLHYAAAGDLAGRKIWSPGVGDDAKPIAQGGPDTFEIQSGPLPLQTDFFYLEPGKCSLWNEYWIAFSNIGIIVAASPELLIGERGEKAFLFAIRDLADLVVNGQRIAAIHASEFVEIQLKRQYEVFCNGVKILPALTEKSPIPEYPDAQDMPTNTAEALVLKGQYRLSRGENRKAGSYFLAALKLDPGLASAHLFLGIDYLKSGLTNLAVEEFQLALKRDHRNPAIIYYLGITLLQIGDMVNAEFFLERALGAAEYRIPATVALAELLLKQHRDWEAIARIETVIRGEDGALCVRWENLVLLELRLTIEPSSQEIRNAILQLSPANALVGTLDGIFPTSARMFLQIIMDLFRRERLEVAKKLLKTYIQRYPKEPIGHYWGAWAFDSLSEFEIAEAISPYGVFPDSLETFAILKALYIKHPDALLLPYYLGVISASLEQWDLAANYWEKTPDLPLAQRGLGLYFSQIKKDFRHAACAYCKGFELASGNVPYKYIYEMCQILHLAGDRIYREKLFSSLKTLQKHNPLVTMAYMQFLEDNEEYEKLLELLKTGSFSLYEGKRDTANYFINANIYLGDKAFAAEEFTKALKYYQEALSYPLHLGVGRSLGRCDMRTKYKICQTLKAMGKACEAQSQAKKFLQEIHDYAFDYAPLGTIRWEDDFVSKDELMAENMKYENLLNAMFETENEGSTTFRTE